MINGRKTESYIYDKKKKKYGTNERKKKHFEGKRGGCIEGVQSGDERG